MVAVKAMLRAAIHPDALSFSLRRRLLFVSRRRGILLYAPANYGTGASFFWGGTGESFGPGRPAADPKVASICVWVRAMAHLISKKSILDLARGIGLRLPQLIFFILHCRLSSLSRRVQPWLFP
jgi:hypothetical protein